MLSRRSFSAFVRELRRLYRSHTVGKLDELGLYRAIRKANTALYLEDIDAKAAETVSTVEENIKTFCGQFNLQIETYLDVFLASRRNLRTRRVQLRTTISRTSDGRAVRRDIYIGPFGEWNQIAVHNKAERDEYYFPSLYTKKMALRWSPVSTFDFEAFVAEVLEDLDKDLDDDDEIPF